MKRPFRFVGKFPFPVRGKAYPTGRLFRGKDYGLQWFIKDMQPGDCAVDRAPNVRCSNVYRDAKLHTSGTVSGRGKVFVGRKHPDEPGWVCVLRLH